MKTFVNKNVVCELTHGVTGPAQAESQLKILNSALGPY